MRRDSIVVMAFVLSLGFPVFASPQASPRDQYQAMQSQQAALDKSRGEDAQARLAALRRKADAGDTEAALQAGQLLWQDDGVPPDEFLARRYFEMAAPSHPLAAFELGQTWRLSPRPDLAQARRWYEQAAQAGIAAAQVELGRLLAQAAGDSAAIAAARGWLERAAQAGEPRGEYLLAVLDEKGIGQSPDLDKAIGRYLRALTLLKDSPVFDLSRPSAQAYVNKRDRQVFAEEAEAIRRAPAHVAELHMARHDVDAAIAAYGQALALDENDQRSRFMQAMLRIGSDQDAALGRVSILRLVQEHYPPAVCQLAMHSQDGSNGFENKPELASAAWRSLATLLLSPEELRACGGDGTCTARLQARVNAGACSP